MQRSIYHGWWCPDPLRRQVISSQYIDIVEIGRSLSYLRKKTKHNSEIACLLFLWKSTRHSLQKTCSKSTNLLLEMGKTRLNGGNITGYQSYK